MFIELTGTGCQEKVRPEDIEAVNDYGDGMAELVVTGEHIIVKHTPDEVIAKLREQYEQRCRGARFADPQELIVPES